ncbi:MAG: hypothetical protein KJN60_02105 [Boseongicola sp.]|nr:hypothetical protein [Boseongicola sp.]
MRDEAGARIKHFDDCFPCFGRKEWRNTAHVIDLYEHSPESEEGQAFLGVLLRADIHIIAGSLHHDGRYGADWAEAFVTSPQRDLGTAWLLFLGSEWPMVIEQ